MALFALLVQFAVSFGHVHVEHARASSPAVSGLAAIPGSEAEAAAVQPGGDKDDDHADHQLCAICILNQMVGTAQTAAPPSLPLALVSRTTEQAFASERIAAKPLPSAFRSRAPPVA